MTRIDHVAVAVAVGVHVVGCGGHAEPPAPAGPAAPACISADDATAREQELADRNLAALGRALGEANLAEAVYDVDHFDAGDAARGNDVDGWQVVEASDRRTLLSPTTYQVCGYQNPWHLARDGRGDLFFLVLQARPAAHQRLTVCGCQADAPIACGGAAPYQVRWRWSLPAGVAFQGPMSLVVDQETSERAYAGRADGGPCPAPTAPP